VRQRAEIPAKVTSKRRHQLRTRTAIPCAVVNGHKKTIVLCPRTNSLMNTLDSARTQLQTDQPTHRLVLIVIAEAPQNQEHHAA